MLCLRIWLLMLQKKTQSLIFSIISTEAGYFSEFLDDFNISDIDDLDTFTNPIIEVVSYCKYLLNTISSWYEIQYMELFNMSEH